MATDWGSLMVVDVDVPATWPGNLQMQFWALSGPAAPLRGRFKKPLFGNSITWLDGEARAYWASVVGDVGAAGGDQPPPPPPGGGWGNPAPGPGPGDSRFCPNCGAPAQPAARFCSACGSPL